MNGNPLISTVTLSQSMLMGFVCWGVLSFWDQPRSQGVTEGGRGTHQDYKVPMGQEGPSKITRCY
eukprot:1161489-Pelagomonas_calceolata.AAC.2